MLRSRLLSVILFMFLISCGKKLPELQGFDRAEFVSDTHGCEGKRLKMITLLDTEKGKLLALDEMQIVNVLGKPDENELYKRNQKFYYYDLTPSPEFCKGTQTDTTSRRLVIRFNAMGLAKEVDIE